MEEKHIIIALTDAAETRMFSDHLAKEGYGVSGAKDGAAALEMAIQNVPSLLIVEPELPVIGGERLFQILRHNPHTSRIPFLFISDDVTDIKHFRTGVDVFLLRPLNFDEVDARIRQTLSIKDGRTPDSKDIEGKLSHMSVPDILQFLQLNNKEGELRVSSGTSTGTVYVKDGQVFNAIVDGVEKEKALFRLLALGEGKFEFLPRQISITRKIRTSTGNMLMEGMRQLDELRKRKDEFPDPDTLVAATVAPDGAPKDLPPVAFEVLRLADEYPKVGEIVDRSLYPDYEVYKAVSVMLSKGLLEKKEGAAAPGVPEEFLTNDQAISIREKVITRFTDMVNVSYGRIMVIATSARQVKAFIDACRRIRGFTINPRTAPGDKTEALPLGEVATFKLYGGMDLVIFAIPGIRDMGPVWNGFSTNLIGLITLWDDAGTAELKNLAAAKKAILARSRVPIAHIYEGSSPTDEDSAFFKRTLGLKADDPIFHMEPGDRSTVAEALYSIFSKLLKEEFAAV